MEEYLRATYYLDWDHPSVAAFARKAAGEAGSDRERAVRLYYAVRDGIRYDPYAFRLAPEFFRASAVLEAGASFCVPKAILLAASARAVGVPSRLGFADVRNHLTTRRLRDLMGTDVFVFHGYTELYLVDRWVKATPTFDRALCERFGVVPLEFDGTADALLHPFDREGRRHMEYLRNHGTFADFPHEEMATAIRAAYPAIFGPRPPEVVGDFEREAAAERLSIEEAGPEAAEAIETLLTQAALPLPQVDPPVSMLVAREGDTVLACGGVERYGAYALVRSVAVAPGARGRGVGRALVRALCERLRASGVREAFLLTTGAAGFFAREGFEPIPRDSIPSALSASPEMSLSCCASAVAMRRRI